MANRDDIVDILKHFALIFLFSAVLSCKKDRDEGIGDTSRTVMVYMAANNSLAKDAYQNINQMEEGFRGIEGDLIVYARIFGQPPKLYQIVNDETPEIRSKVVKTYNDHDSSDPEVMKMVFDDIQRLFPARSYGLVLWSHATNWYPARATVSTRSFGDDNGSEMNIQELKETLPANLDFLIFDACSMASVEVLYELRHTAPYILASPTEVLSVGMPYHLMKDFLFADDVQEGLENIAQSYYSYYLSKEGLEQSATIALIDTRNLENMAKSVAEVLSRPDMDFSRIDRNTLQRMDLDPISPIVAFDFLDLFEQYFTAADYGLVADAASKAVIFKANTDRFLNKPIDRFSGLSCYVPSLSETAVHDFYLGLEWAIDARFDRLFYQQ